MSSDLIQSIVIVGGGTAGWLTAANLAKAFGNSSNSSVKVTLIESPDIPTIGVGEGTWPTMRATLEKLGLDETEFMIACNATFKQGTRFVNWAHDKEANQYFHLFTSIFDPTTFNLAPYWLKGLAGNIPYADAVSAQGVAVDAGLAPKLITSKAYEGVLNYAYHLDAGKFSELLKKHAVEKLGVKLVYANVEQVKLDNQGGIESVRTDADEIIEGDFFVDCSGFKSLLLGEALGIPFQSVSDTLLVDHAIAIQVPYLNEDSPINGCTHSTAQNAGWIWDIGLTNRRGVGHVYSSEFMSHDEAEATLRKYVGRHADGLSSRVIPMNVGYRKKFWHKNCLAIGLSAAFVEPLEASAIFLIEASANMLVDQLPAKKAGLLKAERKFNESFSFRWQRTVSFIKMHYVLSQRTGAFWEKNRTGSNVPGLLLEDLEYWAEHPISAYDFSNVYEPFPMESYQYVLYGMGFLTNLPLPSRYNQVSKATASFEKIKLISEKIKSTLPPQRELLMKMRANGFSRV